MATTITTITLTITTASMATKLHFSKFLHPSSFRKKIHTLMMQSSLSRRLRNSLEVSCWTRQCQLYSRLEVTISACLWTGYVRAGQCSQEQVFRKCHLATYGLPTVILTCTARSRCAAPCLASSLTAPWPCRSASTSREITTSAC